MTTWAEAELDFLRAHYPTRGKAWCSGWLGRGLGAVRSKASELGLKQDRASEFAQDWQRRAASSKVGKKRPAQSDVMRRLHAEGKLPKTAEWRAQKSEAMRAKPRNPKFTTAGLTFSEEVRARVGDGVRRGQARMTADDWRASVEKAALTRAERGTKLGRARPGTTWKAGWREIGGQRAYFRSRWESNYACILDALRRLGKVTSWAHEPRTFVFQGEKRGAVSYLPDFHVVYPDGREEFHEVKGWMTTRSKTQIKRMAKHYPTVVLKVIDSKAYRALAKQWRPPGWE